MRTTRPIEQRTPWAAMRGLAIALLVIVPLLPTLRAAFVYDDTTIIRDNPMLRGWGAPASAWSHPYWPGDGVDALGLYRPLHVSLLSVVWNLGEGSPLLFHLYALVLAAVTSAAVWAVARRGVTTTVAAFVAAAWFATHPLHVEVVASVANSSEMLVVLCILALAWILARGEPAADAPIDWTRAVIAGVLAAAAIGAKESGLLAVPLAALTAWGWRRPGDAPRAGVFVRRNARVWAAALIGVTAVILQRLVVLGAPISHGSIAAQGLGDMAAGERALAMASLWPRIASMLAWPASLSPYYGASALPAQRVPLALLGAGVLAALGALAAVAARRGDRRPLVALGWGVLTYLPASNLLAPTGQILADRTLFGVTVGAALALAWGLDRVSLRWRAVGFAMVALLALRGAVMSTGYAVSWTSHRTLWARLAEVAPAEHLTYKLSGMDARARGDTSRALALLERAHRMAPADRQIRFELGQLNYSMGRYAEAVAMLAPLMRDDDARSERDFVALYLDAIGRAGGPHAVIRAATPLLRSVPAPVAALFIGAAHQQLGNRPAAESAYAAGLRRAPSDTALLRARSLLR